MNAEPWRRTVECFDLTGRDRELTLAVAENGRLALRTPPGELAVITLSGGDTLKRVISEAQQAVASSMLGMPSPTMTGGLREAQTFYVTDAHNQVVPIGVGLNGWNVAVNGPRWWQADEGTMIAIAAKQTALVQISRDQRRLGR